MLFIYIYLYPSLCWCIAYLQLLLINLVFYKICPLNIKIPLTLPIPTLFLPFLAENCFWSFALTSRKTCNAKTCSLWVNLRVHSNHAVELVSVPCAIPQLMVSLVQRQLLCGCSCQFSTLFILNGQLRDSSHDVNAGRRERGERERQRSKQEIRNKSNKRIKTTKTEIVRMKD